MRLDRGRSSLGPSMLACSVLALVHLVSLPNPLIWDDPFLVIGHPVVSGDAALLDAFRTGAFGEPLENSQYYRPMQTLSLALDSRLHAASPTAVQWIRATNVFLHAVTAALLVLFLTSLGARLLVAGWAAALFAVHPAGVEAVDYIASRGDVLGAALGTGSLVLAVRGHRFGSLVAACLLGIAALLSKEHLLMLPAIGGVLALRLRDGRIGRYAAALAVPAVALLAWRISHRLGAEGQTLALIADAELKARILTLPEIVLTYAQIIFWPVGLHTDRQFAFDGWSLETTMGAILVVALVAACRWLRREQTTMLILAGIWFLPFSQILPLAATAADRWSYLLLAPALAAVIGTLARSISRWPRTGVALHAGLAIVAVLWTAGAVDRIRDWSSPESLYARDVHLSPQSFLLRTNLGVLRIQDGDYEEAERWIRDGIRVAPAPYGPAWNALGTLQERKGHFDEAGRSYYTAIQASRDPEAYGNLARLLIERGDAEAAGQLLAEGLKHHPRNRTLQHLERSLSPTR